MKNQLLGVPSPTHSAKTECEDVKDEVYLLKQQLSDKTNRILDLNEKLQLSQETLQGLEERISKQ